MPGLNHDPIEDSSPVKQQDTTYIASDDESDADALFDDIDPDNTVHTVPTQPIQRTQQKISRLVGILNSSPPPPEPFITQPTQILSTPPRHNSRVQVPRTSPLPSESPIPHRPQVRSIGLAMAPPGTQFNPPPPMPAMSQFDDPPVDPDSEDELAPNNSDIKPAKWARGSKGSRDEDELSRAEPRVSSFSGKFKVDDFLYQPGPSSNKRKSDDMAGANGNSTRPAKQARQTGPSRAQPVPDVSIADLGKYKLRDNIPRLQKIYPKADNPTCERALVDAKGNLDDALDLLAQRMHELEELEKQDQEDEELDDGIMNRMRGVAQQKRPSMAKPVVNKPGLASMASRYSKLNQGSSSGLSSQQLRTLQASSQALNIESQSSDVVRPRRRLKQGRRHRSTSPPEQIQVESDDDSGVGDDSEASDEPEESSFHENMLEVINVSSAEDLTDFSQQPTDVIELITTSRPFTTLNAVKALTLPSKSRKPRMAGQRFIEACEKAMTSFRAIDELAKHCGELGKPLADKMKEWGVKLSESQNTSEAELELVSLPMDNSGKDSGIGTPSGTPPHKRKDQEKAGYLGKPSNMSKGFELKDYQIVGLNWLNLLFEHGLSGILADDMGLGKTCQVITFLSHLKETNVEGPHLVIVPSSTLENWLREFARFSPDLNVEPYHGKEPERAEIRYQILNNLDMVDVIVTTYQIAESDKGDAAFLRKLPLNVVVYDEGQMLKNPTSKRYKTAMRLKCQFRLLLSGTPVQNNLQELTALLGMIMPDVFEEHKEDLDFIFKHKAKTSDADHAALLSTRRIEKARQMMAPFILRRKKQQVLHNLPPKTFRVEYCDLTPVAQEVYEEIEAEADEATGTKNRSQQKTQQKKKTRSNSDAADAAKIETTELVGTTNTNWLMKLRQAAIHRLLLQRLYTEADIEQMVKLAHASEQRARTNRERMFFQWVEFSDGSLVNKCHFNPALADWMLDEEVVMDSGKIKKLLEILAQHEKNGDRTLIFSQFNGMLDILEVVLNMNDMEFLRLDGSTSINDRQYLIDQYNEEDSKYNVFLLNTKAGGVGINLPTANKVIIFDIGFNPQEEVQAGNRAHRVGQTRPVEVITLVTRDTIEEKIYALAESKLKLDQQVAGEVVDEEAEREAIAKIEEALVEQIKAESPLKTRTPAKKTPSNKKTPLENKASVKTETPSKKTKDAKAAFMDGLKNAGLDMSAADEDVKMER